MLTADQDVAHVELAAAEDARETATAARVVASLGVLHAASFGFSVVLGKAGLFGESG